MPWTLYQDMDSGLEPVAEFKPTPLARLDKKTEVADLVETLDGLDTVMMTAFGNTITPLAKADRKKAARWVAGAQAFVNKDVKKLHGSLKVAQVRFARAIADEKSKKRKMNKKVLAQVKVIEGLLRAAIPVTDRKFLIPRIAERAEEMLAADRADVMRKIAPVSRSFKSCAARGHPEIAEAARSLRDWNDGADAAANTPIADAIGSALFDAARDMSQNIVNMNKAIGYGLDIPGFEQKHYTAIPKLGKSLTPIANAQTGSLVTKGMDKTQLAKLIRTMQVNANLYDQISGALP